MDQLPRLGKRELICLLSFTCNYVVFVWRGFLFLWVLGMGYVILLWHSLSLPYNYFGNADRYILSIITELWPLIEVQNSVLLNIIFRGGISCLPAALLFTFSFVFCLGNDCRVHMCPFHTGGMAAVYKNIIHRKRLPCR